jgi:hypothetical protein
MAVRFFYVDESYDDTKFCLSAISIRHTHWRECFDLIRQHRVSMNKDHGISAIKEIHAKDFVRGRGHISSHTLSGEELAELFFGILKLVASLPTMKIFNICLPRKSISGDQIVAWDRLVNRIERTMNKFDEDEQQKRAKDIAVLKALATTGEPLRAITAIEKRLALFRARAFIIADEGREKEITKAVRKMHVHNPIPSRFGGWTPGHVTKNITTDRLIEDPVFKSSQRSYFLQLADCVAFSLLKREVPPTLRVEKYGLHKMFDAALSGVCFLKASRTDKLGIVRA